MTGVGSLIHASLGAIVLMALNLATPASGQTASATNKTMSTTNKTELATIAGGCFWCIEASFQPVPGVIKVVSGYSGGKTDKTTYKEVCSGTTGHAEAVQITFDPSKISYEKILDVFWEAHDPTTVNRQGHDIGTQYRSVIFYHNDAQKAAAEKSKAAIAKKFKDPVVTEIVPMVNFIPAEDYHQNYFNLNPGNPYCQTVIRPKLEKLRKKLDDK